MNLFSIKVDFALSLFDDFDGVRINDNSFTFIIDGQVFKPIRKSDGFYVFCGLNINGVLDGIFNEISLQIKHPHYHEHHENFILNSETSTSTLFRIIKIRLQRKYSGRYRDCEWFEHINHSVPANSDVIGFAKVTDKAGKDVPVDSDTESLWISNAHPRYPLLGRRFALNPEINSEPTFIITQKAPNMHKYLIEGNIPAVKSHILYAVYYSKTGPDGVLCIPHVHCERIIRYAYRERGMNEWVSVSVVEDS
jgi:hypothetical protein